MLDAGFAAAPEPSETMKAATTALSRYCALLSRSQGEMLRIIASVYPMSISREDVSVEMERRGLKASLKSSSFVNNLSRLKVLEGIQYVQGGRVMATDSVMVGTR